MDSGGIDRVHALHARQHGGNDRTRDLVNQLPERRVFLWRTADDENGHSAARRMFRFSLLYLAGLFAALPVDRIVIG